MAKASTEDLLESFKGMTLLELSEFIKAFEEEFGVEAAAMAAPVAAAGDKKIQVIKEVRALTSLGLKEAKDLVDGAPKPVLEKVAKEAADQAKEKIEAAGGTVSVK